MLSTLQRRVAHATIVLCFCAATSASPDARVPDAEEEANYVEALASRELHDEVVREARAFLSKHADHDAAHRVRYRMAGSLEAKGDASGACREYERLSEEEDFLYVNAARLRFARCELNGGDAQAARRAAVLCDEVAQKGEVELKAPALLLAGEAWRRSGEPARAVTALTSLLGMERTSVSEEARFEARHALAASAFEAGDGEQALAAIEKARRLKGARALELSRIEARALALLERHGEAAKAFESLAENQRETDANRRIALREAAFCAVRGEDSGRAARLFDELRGRLRRGEESLPAETRRELLAEAALQAGAHHFLAGDARKARLALAEDVLDGDLEATLWRARAELADRDAQAARKTTEGALRRFESADAQQREQLCLLLAQACEELGDSAAAAEARERSGSAAGVLSAAAAHLAQGRLDEAERAASRVPAETPESTAARWILAEVSFSRGRYERAEERYEEARAGASPERRGAIDGRLAWCAYLTEDWAVAERRFSSLLERDTKAPEVGDAREMRARCILEGARASETGEERLVQLLDEPTVPEAVALDGRRLLSSRLAARGEHAAALPHWEALVAADRSDGGAAYGLAAALARTDQCARAAKVVEASYPRAAAAEDERALSQRMIELGLWCATKEKDVETLRVLAFAWIDSSADESACLERLRPAARTLRESSGAGAALELWTRFAKRVERSDLAREVALEIAWLELESERLDRAEALADAALRGGARGPSMADLCFALGEARFETAPERARIHYTNALERSGEVSPETAARCLYKLGFEAARREDQVQAAKFFERLGTSPDFRETALRGEALTLAGEAAFLSGDAARASRLLRKQHAEFPRHETAPRALFRWAQAASELGEDGDVLEALRELQRIAPGFEPAIECDFMRGCALASAGKADEARRALQRVIEADVASGVFAARARLRIGRLAEAEGDDEAALSEYLKVALLFGGDLEVCEALVRAGDVLQERGDVDAARERWRECVERGAKKENEESSAREWVRAARERLSR